MTINYLRDDGCGQLVDGDGGLHPEEALGPQRLGRGADRPLVQDPLAGLLAHQVGNLKQFGLERVANGLPWGVVGGLGKAVLTGIELQDRRYPAPGRCTSDADKLPTARRWCQIFPNEIC